MVGKQLLHQWRSCTAASRTFILYLHIKSLLKLSGGFRRLRDMLTAANVVNYIVKADTAHAFVPRIEFSERLLLSDKKTQLCHSEWMRGVNGAC